MPVYKTQEKLDTIDAINLSYMAGIVDGEGSIFIARYKAKRLLSRLKYRYQLKMCVVNTSKNLIVELHELFGGSTYLCHKRKITNHQLCWQWYNHGHETVKILKLLYPYLRLKKKQADIAFDFQKLYSLKRSPNGGYSHGPIPANKEEYYQQTKFYQKMKRLHHIQFEYK